jgi:hypothetical protein
MKDAGSICLSLDFSSISVSQVKHMLISDEIMSIPLAACNEKV